MGEHRPVLLGEVLEVLRPGAGRRFLDGTFGRGGHSRALLERGAVVLALDRDPEAVAAGRVLQREWPERFEMRQMKFGDMGALGEREGRFDGVLLDLGVSSPQLETAERGFSFERDGPLDMRMDPGQGRTAAEVVNGAGEEELAGIFREYGEEPRARRVAAAVVRARGRAPLVRTGQLAAVVEEAVGGRRGARRHPATRVFQALRIAVNDELGELDRALAAAPGLLQSGGRLAVISFHGLEDGRVKRFIARCGMAELRGEASPFGAPNPEYCLRPLGRHLPSVEEVEANPRSRSARLRAAERI